MRGLVRQTSGFRDYFDESFIETLWADPSRVWAPEELVAIAAKGAPLGLPDDGDSDYSNTNYVLLGLVMQKASGMSLAAVLRRYVYSPLHMTQAASWEEATLRSDVAGYIPADGELIEVDGLDLSMSWGACGMISTARDVARLTRGMLTGGMLTGDVLSKADRDVVMNGFGPIKGRQNQTYGYAVSKTSFGGVSLLGTTGRGGGLRHGQLLRAGHRQHVHGAEQPILRRLGRDDCRGASDSEVVTLS